MRIPREQPWPADRRAARAALKAWRASLGASERAVMNASLVESVEQRLIHWLSIGQVENPVLGVYWAIRDEPDLSGHFARWRDLGFELALPVTPEEPAPLRFARWRDGDEMVVDKMRIQTPARRTWVTAQVLVVPCLGYSRHGYRLGYGGGYYDRTLVDFRGLSLGIAYSACELTTFIPQEHDIALDEIITER